MPSLETPGRALAGSARWDSILTGSRAARASDPVRSRPGSNCLAELRGFRTPIGVESRGNDTNDRAPDLRHDQLRVPDFDQPVPDHRPQHGKFVAEIRVWSDRTQVDLEVAHQPLDDSSA